MIQVDPVVIQRAQYKDAELTDLFNMASEAVRQQKNAKEDHLGYVPPGDNWPTTKRQMDHLEAQNVLNGLRQSVNTRALLMKAPPSEQKAQPSLEDSSPNL